LADWQVRNIAKTEVANGTLNLGIAGSDPYFHWPVAIDGSRHTQLQVRMKNGSRR
jgi:hypothetical protein